MKNVIIIIISIFLSISCEQNRVINQEDYLMGKWNSYEYNDHENNIYYEIMPEIYNRYATGFEFYKDGHCRLFADYDGDGVEDTMSGEDFWKYDHEKGILTFEQLEVSRMVRFEENNSVLVLYENNGIYIKFKRSEL